MVAWARSAVVPRGGGFGHLQAHDIGAPVLTALLQRAGLPPQAVDAVVAGNALGAGGNPARMVALAAGLPERCAALTVDTQCCAGLDAVALGVGLLASGQASVVVAGGVEAWSRAPVRMHRPQRADEAPEPYERPAFAPPPWSDPDMLASAAQYAEHIGCTREQQDRYAVLSHQRAVQHRECLTDEVVPVAGVSHDPYPRLLDLARVARMPTVPATRLGPLTVSAKADGAAWVLLATEQACARWGLRPQALWSASASVGVHPATPLLAAERAGAEAMHRAGRQQAADLRVIEVHDAFAVQGLDLCQRWELPPDAINRRGGGLARGHPIGASAAVALVRMLSDLARDGLPGDRGLAAVAGAGGLGASVVVERLG
jgi:acetyl-CoA C-acetyltransferase